MGPEDSLPCSQQPSTRPYLEPVKPVYKSSHPNSIRSILIISSNLRIGLARRPFSKGFPNYILYSVLISQSVLPISLTPVILLYLVAIIMPFSQTISYFLSVLYPNIFLANLFSDTFNQCSSGCIVITIMVSLNVVLL